MQARRHSGPSPLRTALLSGFTTGLLQYLRDQRSPTPSSKEDRWSRILTAAGSGFVTSRLLGGIADPGARVLTSGLVTLTAAGLARGCPEDSRAQLILSSVSGAAGWPAATAIYEAIESALPRLLPGSGQARHRIFISHSWKHYSDHSRLLDGLRGLGHTIYDHSVPNVNPLPANTDKELYEGLRRQIQGSSVVLLMARPGVERHPWMQAEVKIASDLGKPILAVRPHGKAGVPMLSSWEAAVSDKVGWNMPAISRRLRRLKEK